MANTFELIQTFNAASGGSAYADFTSIPSTYTDLRFIVSSRNTNIYNEIHWRINGVSSGYRWMYVQGYGSTKQQDLSSSGGEMQGMVQAVSGSPAGTFGAGNLNIFFYSDTNMAKIILGTSAQGNNNNSFLTSWNAGSTNSNTTVSSVRAFSSIGNLAEGTKISLYGIKNA
jgi:hypothetical protein